MPYTVASPSPVPCPRPLVVKNGSNNRACTSGVDARAGVGDRERAYRPGAQRRRRPGARAAPVPLRRRHDEQLPAARHRVARVHRQVQHHLLQLRGSARTAAASRGTGSELDVLADQPAQHAAPCRTTTSFRSSTPGSSTCSPAERQQLPGQRGGALRGAADLRHVAAGGARRARCRPARRSRVAEDDGEQVVEVVRDAAGQLPTASIFCDCRSCSCDAFRAISVRRRSEMSAATTSRTRVAPYRSSSELISTSIVRPSRVTCWYGLARVGPSATGLHLLPEDRRVLGRPDVEHGARQELLAAVAIVGNGRVVHRDEAQRLHLVHPHRDRHGVEQRAVPPLAGPQLVAAALQRLGHPVEGSGQRAELPVGLHRGAPREVAGGKGLGVGGKARTGRTMPRDSRKASSRLRLSDTANRARACASCASTCASATSLGMATTMCHGARVAVA